MIGATYGDKRLVRTFCAHFVGQETDRGITALMLSVLYNNMECQELLNEDSVCLKQQTLQYCIGATVYDMLKDSSAETQRNMRMLNMNTET